MSCRGRFIVALCGIVVVAGCNRSSPTKLDTPANKRNEPAAADNQAVPPKDIHEGYVGSDRCVECHEQISQQYQQHSMGRSAVALTSAIEMPQADNAEFEADGYRYSVRKDGDRWIHHQGRIAKDGSEVASIDFVAKHMIGSGNHGQSFLVERDGHLLMSPITWYPDKQIWDLSPGYEKNNSQFNRPVVENCVYCHTDLATAVPNTLNRYAAPPIRTHAIGCERCHGPGEQHIALHSASTELANSQVDPIVNPAKLGSDLREAVCQQCHLSGAARITKSGKSLYDFRPGGPLEAAYTIFTDTSSTQDATSKQEQKEFVGHVEQMYASKCFQQSDGALGCISCHDPHQLPAADQRVSFYRDRCLACHESEACAEDLSVRRAETNDNCIHCHMPVRQTEIRHAAVTDHSMPRHGKAEKRTEQTLSKELRLVAFPSNEKAKPSSRDRALALVRVGSKNPERVPSQQLDIAQRALESAVATDPTDYDAMDALAELHLAGNDFDNVMKVCRQVLARVPERESTLVIAGDTYSETRGYSHAIPYWKRAIQVNPWMSRYWYRLGQAYAETQQWDHCRQLANEAKRRFPTSIGVRHLLLRSNLALGAQDQAEREYQELEAFNPQGFDSIRDWYQSHSKP